MEPTKGESKPKSKLKVLLVLAIIIAAVAGAYYYASIPHAPPQFSMTVNPSSFHAAAGGGFILFIQVNRVTGFTSDVNVTLLNPPNWISAATLVLNSTSVNGTMAVPLSKQALKGSYQLTVVGTAQGSADQTSTVSLKVVDVNPVTSPRGYALVYETTKTLDAGTLAGLVSFVNGTFQFSHSTSLLDGLQPGDVIAASFNETPILPHGFLRTVLDVRQQNGGVFVDTREASLLEAAQEIEFGVKGSSSIGSSGTSVSSVGLQPENAIDACNGLTVCEPLYNQAWQPLGANGQNLCSTPCDSNFYLGGMLQIYLGAGGHISWSGIDWIVAGLFGHEEADANIKGSAGDQFTWHNDDIQTLYTNDIPIIPPILNFHIEVDLAGRSLGTLLENVNTGIDQTYDLVLAVTDNANNAPSSIQAYCQGGGWNLCAKSIPTVNPNIHIEPPRNPGSFCSPGSSGDCPRVEIGPKLSIGIDGTIEIASVSGSGYFEADVFWELDNQAQGVPVWSLYIGLDGSLDFSVSAGFNYPCGAGCNWNGCWISTCYDSVFSYTPNPPWSLGDFYKKDIADAGNFPPPTPTLIIPNSADTIELENPAFLNPNMFSNWATLSGVEPEGEAVTCIWQTAELGQLGTSSAVASSNSLVCHGPGGAFSVDQINKIISLGLTKITVTVIAEDSAGEKSSPSNAVTVTLKLPVPVLQIEYPTNGTTVSENQPFNAIGAARTSTVISNTSPNGIIDLCQTEPQNIAWFVGGYYQADIVDVGEGGWVGAQSSGASCNPALAATSPGQTMINMAYLATDPKTGNQYIAQDNNGNPIYVSVTVNVQAQTSQPPPPPSGVSQLVVAITTPPGAYSGNSPITPSSPPIQLAGTVTGGTPPYTITWYAQSGTSTATIVTGDSSILVYAWNVGGSCNALGFPRGTVLVFLTATDSTGAKGNSPAGPIQVNVNCQVAQSLPFGIGMTLVSLLTVLFAVTAERSTILESKPWLNMLR